MIVSAAQGAEIKGTVKDGQTGELLTGCTFYVHELQTGTISGLDGSYRLNGLKAGRYTLTCVFIKKGNPDNGGLPHHAASDSQTLLRDESMHRIYLIGIRYQL